MDRYLETACGWFGALSCESASAPQVFMMLLSAAFLGLFVAWLVSKVLNSG